MYLIFPLNFCWFSKYGVNLRNCMLKSYFPPISTPNFLIENIFIIFITCSISIILISCSLLRLANSTCSCSQLLWAWKTKRKYFLHKTIYTNYDCKRRLLLKILSESFYPNQKNTWLKQKGSKMIFFLKSSVIFTTNFLLVQSLSDRKRNACLIIQLWSFYTIT